MAPTDYKSEDYKELGLHISVTAGIFITKSIIYPKGRILLEQNYNISERTKEREK
jgi:hypothetical protein